MTLDYRIHLLTFNILFDPTFAVGNCKVELACLMIVGNPVMRLLAAARG
jgi:hypothetical protein